MSSYVQTPFYGNSRTTVLCCRTLKFFICCDCCRKICGAIVCCAMVAPVLIIGMWVLIGWNEVTTICQAKHFDVAQKYARQVGCREFFSGDGNLIHFTCQPCVLDPATMDPPEGLNIGGMFSHVRFKGYGVHVKVEMLQCVEKISLYTALQANQARITSRNYDYSMQWVDHWIDSSEFARPYSQEFKAGCGAWAYNPPWTGELPVSGRRYATSIGVTDVIDGKETFVLGEQILMNIPLTRPLQLTPPAGWARDVYSDWYLSNKFRIELAARGKTCVKKGTEKPAKVKYYTARRLGSKRRKLKDTDAGSFQYFLEKAETFTEDTTVMTGRACAPAPATIWVPRPRDAGDGPRPTRTVTTTAQTTTNTRTSTTTTTRTYTGNGPWPAPRRPPGPQPGGIGDVRVGIYGGHQQELDRNGSARRRAFQGGRQHRYWRFNVQQPGRGRQVCFRGFRLLDHTGGIWYPISASPRDFDKMPEAIPEDWFGARARPRLWCGETSGGAYLEFDFGESFVGHHFSFLAVGAGDRCQSDPQAFMVFATSAKGQGAWELRYRESIDCATLDRGGWNSYVLWGDVVRGSVTVDDPQPEYESCSVLGFNDNAFMTVYTDQDVACNVRLAGFRFGIWSPDELFRSLDYGGTSITWLIRIAAFLVLWLAVCLCIGPLGWVMVCMPHVGLCVCNIIDAIACGLSFIPAIMLTIGLMGLIYVFFWPLMGVLMIGPLLLLLATCGWCHVLARATASDYGNDTPRGHVMGRSRQTE